MFWRGGAHKRIKDKELSNNKTSMIISGGSIINNNDKFIKEINKDINKASNENNFYDTLMEIVLKKND